MAFAPGGNQLEVEVTSSGVSGFNSAMNSAIGSMLSFRTAALALGGVLVTLGAVAFAAAVSSARDWNAEVREMRKVMDPAEVQAVSAAVIDLSAELPVATNQIASLATQARRFGIEGAENIANFTEAVVKMSVATDVSINDAGEAFARLIALTDASVDEIENLGSAINTMGQTSATSSAQIVDGMLRSAAALTQLGLTAPEIVGLQASINEVSESAQRAGTRLRRLAQEFADPARLQEIARGYIDAGLAQTSMSDAVLRASDSLESERGVLLRLQDDLRETVDEINGLADANDNLSEGIQENQIAIGEIRKQARDENRELTEDEKQQIEELRNANEDLRLEMDKNRLAMDKLEDTREAQTNAVESQADAVEAAEDSLESMREASAEELVQQFEDAPLETIQDWARAMRDGGEEADILRENLSAVSIQALSSLGQNIDDTAEGTGDLTDNLANANEAYVEGISLQQEYAIESDSLGSDLQRLRNQFRNTASSVGQNFIPELREAIRWTTDLVAGFSALSEETDGMAGVMGIAALIAGGLALSVAALGAPVALLAGLVAGLALAWETNFGGIRDVWASVWSRIQAVWDEHGAALFGEGGEVRQVLDQLEAFWAEWGDEIEAIVSFVFDTVGGIVVWAFDLLLTVFRVGLNLLNGDWEEAWLVMADFFVDTFNGILTWAGKWGGRFVDYLISGLPDELEGAFRDALGLTGPIELWQGPVIESPFASDLARIRREERLAGVRADVGQSDAASMAPPGTRDTEVVLRVDGDGELADLIRRNARAEIGSEGRRAKRRRGRPSNA